MTRRKKLLINNAIALGIHVIMVILLWYVVLPWYMVRQMTDGSVDESVRVFLLFAVYFLYLPCGLLLRTVDKFSYLSVLSVFVGLLLVTSICISGADYWYIPVFNPVFLSLWVLFDWGWPPETAPAILSVPVPSLLMWFGLLIKMRMKKSKGNEETHHEAIP